MLLATWPWGNEMDPQLASSKNFRAAVDESMSMSPPFLGTFWRELPPGSSIVDEHIVNPYCLMHNGQDQELKMLRSCTNKIDYPQSLCAVCTRGHKLSAKRIGLP